MSETSNAAKKNIGNSDTHQMSTPAYNVDRTDPVQARYNGKPLMYILLKLNRIHASLRIANNYHFLYGSKHSAFVKEVYFECMSKLENEIKEIDRVLKAQDKV